MDYTINYPEQNTAVINIQVSKEDWARQIEAAKQTVQSDDADSLRQYAISNVASQVLGEAIEKDKLRLATTPAIIADDDENGNVLITLTCSLLPEVKLPAYTGMNLTQEPAVVEEEEIMEEITRRINAEKIWNKLPEGAKAQDGDRVLIDFIGEKDGVPFEGGSAKNYALVLGSGTFIPGFEEQLIGVEAGQSKDVEVTFPENYFEPSLAGAPVVFHVTVNEIEEEVVPELSDAFLEKIGLEGVKTVEQFKEKVAAELKGLKEQEAQNKLMMEIVGRVADGSQVDIPDAMIANQVDQHLTELENNLKQYGMSLDQYLEMTHQTLDEFKKLMMPQAALEIRQALVLEAIAVEQDIQAEQKEIDEEYALLSSVYNFPAEQLKTLIPQGAVATQIIQKKTLDYLKDQNIAK